MNTIRIQIKDLKINDALNVRADDLSQLNIAQYTEIYDQLPPVSVFLVANDYWLVDGWHRIGAAKNLELTEIEVLVVGEGSLIEAEDYADSANLSHGIPLTPKQRRLVAVRFAKRHPEWSFVRISQAMNCSDKTIKAWLAKEASSEYSEGNNSNQKKASQSDRAGSIDIKAVSLKFMQWFNTSKRREPIESWSDKKKADVKAQLKPMVELYQRL